MRAAVNTAAMQADADDRAMLEALAAPAPAITEADLSTAKTHSATATAATISEEGITTTSTSAGARTNATNGRDSPPLRSAASAAVRARTLATPAAIEAATAAAVAKATEDAARHIVNYTLGVLPTPTTTSSRPALAARAAPLISTVPSVTEKYLHVVTQAIARYHREKKDLRAAKMIAVRNHTSFQQVLTEQIEHTPITRVRRVVPTLQPVSSPPVTTTVASTPPVASGTTTSSAAVTVGSATSQSTPTTTAAPSVVGASGTVPASSSATVHQTPKPRQD